jgi:glutathione S-transferase
MQTLYFVPGACSLVPHIVLREAGAEFETDKVNPSDKKTASGQDYNAINPKGSVPALRMDNGEILTEVAVIVQYVADKFPEKNLLPAAGSMERYRAQEWLNYISSELHKTLGALFNPQLPAEAREIFKQRAVMRLNFVAHALDGRDYLMGSTFTVADAYLFVVLGWAPHIGLDLSPWPAIQGYLGRIAARPPVLAALKAEGLVK